MIHTRWKIDPNPDLTTAIIEDDEDGTGIIEFPDRSDETMMLAGHIVDLHNRWLTRPTVEEILTDPNQDPHGLLRT